MTTVTHDWRKARASSNQTNCVEVSRSLEALRDSKNPRGPILPVNAAALVAAVRRGAFDGR